MLYHRAEATVLMRSLRATRDCYEFDPVCRLFKLLRSLISPIPVMQKSRQ